MSSTNAAQKVLYNKALRLHQQGELTQARVLYQNVIRRHPRHSDALRKLTELCLQASDPAAALAAAEKALAIDAADRAALRGKAKALQAAGRHAECLALMMTLASSEGADATLMFEMGVSYQAVGDRASAINAYQAASSIDANHLPALVNRLVLLESQAERSALREGSIELLRRMDELIAIEPGNVEYHQLRGHSLRWAGQSEEAIDSYLHVLSLDPRNVAALVNIGHTNHDLKRLEQAVDYYRQALEIDPSNALVWTYHGNSLGEIGRDDEAVDSLQQAVIHANRDPLTHCFFGNALRCVNRLDEALAELNIALSLDPALPVIHWNLSRVLLVAGDFQGWRHFEARWDVKALGLKHRYSEIPTWLGEQSVNGKTLLLHAEQGYGDTLQFCRYAPLLALEGARVILQVQPPLVSLLRCLPGVDSVISNEENPPQFDLHCPLMSLPLAMGTTLETVPHAPCYLAADPQKVQRWADRLGSKNAIRIGLAWSGSTAHVNDHERSMTLQTLVASLPEGFEYICLQKEVRDCDAAALQSGQIALRFFGQELEDFSDTAALCTLMDLVISVDTSVAHLAGALGVNTWLMLPFCPDYRWMLERHDTPWYPMMTVLRQTEAGNWDSVMNLISNALSQ